MPDASRPVTGLSGAQAAEILGITELSVARLVLQGVLHKLAKHQRHGLDLAEVERVSLERYRRGHSYWLMTREAAVVLGCSDERVRQLVLSDRLPFVVRNGRRLFRRPQVEVIANAREARRQR